MSESEERAPSVCRCTEIERLDGEEAEAYASGHLRAVEKGRGNYDWYDCQDSGTNWIMDFPLRHWARDQRGRVRLRREPIDTAALPIDALDLGS